jgi:hypothetical protein
MNLSDTRSALNPSRLFARLRARPGIWLGIIILVALIAFEMFNYSTTDYALKDLLGDLQFAGMSWATILAIAFCGIDFAGVARLFTPRQGADEPKQVWYLFAAWLLAATMNAVLTWWGVSMAIANHNVVSRSVIGAEALNTVVPVFVAIMVWVIRILIIGSISVNAERVLGMGARPSSYRRPVNSSASQASLTRLSSTPANTSGGLRPASVALPRPASPMVRPSASVQASPSGRPEPTYHSVTGRPASSTTMPVDHSSNL